MRASVSNSQDLGMPAIYLHTLAELLHTIGVDERDLILRVDNRSTYIDQGLQNGSLLRGRA